MKLARALAALLLAFASGACIGRGGSADPNVFRVAALTGAAEVRAAGARTWNGLTQGADVPAGASIRFGGDVSVTLSRAGDSTIEVRPFEQRAEFTVTAPGAIEVTAGDVLVTSDTAAPIAVRAGDVDAIAARNGVFRVDRRLSLRVGVYAGGARVSLFDDSLDLPPLQESIVAGRALPRASDPLVYDASDPWDRRLLADAIALDAELQTAARGFRAEFGARLTTASLFAPLGRDLGRDVAFIGASLATTDGGDVLIALVLALHLDQTGDDDAATVFPRLLRELDQGATWGIVAKRHGAIDELGDAVVRAIGVVTGVVTPGEGRGRSTSSPRPRPTRTPTTRPTTSPSPSHSPSPSTSPSPTEPPPPPPCSPVDQLLGRC